ncbi:hypothetical protein PAERUG_E16_London_17_VIM_2_04_14_03148 [Pseudomonas aeruginosa]|nr:hypothetical protein PAERUG_E16_London_17_VIM_2_04_14_03148 [Pseudomonas aeruginosa]
MATLMSAPASTGTSLTPSPSISTRRPSPCRRSSMASLSSGVRPPRASSMPSSAATLATIGEASPDSRRVRQPRALQAASRAGASLRRRSSRPNQASGPCSSPSSSHCPESPGIAGVALPPRLLTKAAWPMRRRRPSTRPSRPSPGWLATLSAASGARPKARAMGCSERFSRAAARARQRSASRSRRGSTCLSVRRPSVRVPVLSKITVSMWFSPSSTCPRVISRPSLCRLPVAAVSAVGVASDRAQGQVATSSDSTTQKARWWSTCHHSAPTAAATSRTMSRNHCATLSASSARRGLSAWARSSRRTMADRRLSSPRAPTSTVSGPSTFRVPPVTASPAWRGWGRYSPVSSDSSTLDWPSRITPSAGSTAPGGTSTRSPTRSSLSRMRSPWLAASRRRQDAGSRLTSCAVEAAVRSRARRSR